MIQFFFAISNGFSGQTFYDSVAGVVYNIIFTSVPIVIVAISDQDKKDTQLMANPELYKQCQQGIYVCLKNFLKTFLITKKE